MDRPNSLYKLYGRFQLDTALKNANDTAMSSLGVLNIQDGGIIADKIHIENGL